MGVQSSGVYKGHLALGKVFATGPYKRFMVRDAASSKLCGTCAPLRAPRVFPKESSDFAALLKRIVAKNGFECIGQISFSLKTC